MPGMRFKGLVGLVIASSMLASSTEAMASQQISPWATLTALSGGAPAAAVCGAVAATAAAAQPGAGCVLPVADPAPPPPANAGSPPPPLGAAAPMGYGATPLLLGLVAIAGAVAVILAVKNHGNGQRQPSSPA